MIGQSVDNNNIQIKVLGFGQHISMGLIKGEVTDLLKLSDAISKAVEKPQKLRGKQGGSHYLSSKALIQRFLINLTNCCIKKLIIKGGELNIVVTFIKKYSK